MRTTGNNSPVGRPFRAVATARKGRPTCRTGTFPSAVRVMLGRGDLAEHQNSDTVYSPLYLEHPVAASLKSDLLRQLLRTSSGHREQPNALRRNQVLQRWADQRQAGLLAGVGQRTVSYRD
jgi:hypothetical protein